MAAKISPKQLTKAGDNWFDTARDMKLQNAGLDKKIGSEVFHALHGGQLLILGARTPGTFGAFLEPLGHQPFDAPATLLLNIRMSRLARRPPDKKLSIFIISNYALKMSNKFL